MGQKKCKEEKSKGNPQVLLVIARRYSDEAIQRWFASYSLAKTEYRI
jgi:hypothetical protein